MIRRRFEKLRPVIGVAVTALLVALICLYLNLTSVSTAEQLREVRRSMLAGKYSNAEPLVRELLISDEQNDALWLMAAECADARNDTSQALSDLGMVMQQDTAEWLTAQHLKANLLKHKAHRLGDAVRLYDDILRRNPQDTIANDELARLLGLCGLRDAAVPHVLQLIAAGQTTDLLMLLARDTWGIAACRACNCSRKSTCCEYCGIDSVRYA